MTNTMKKCLGGAAVAAAVTMVGNSASAQSLETPNDVIPQQCDMKFVRIKMTRELEMPDQLLLLSDILCGCEVVTDKMLEYLRRHQMFEVILGQTSEQCPGFARVLSDVKTATIRKDIEPYFGPADNGGDGVIGGGKGGSNGGNGGGSNGGNGGGSNGGNGGGSNGGNGGGSNGGNGGGWDHHDNGGWNGGHGGDKGHGGKGDGDKGDKGRPSGTCKD